MYILIFTFLDGKLKDKRHSILLTLWYGILSGRTVEAIGAGRRLRHPLSKMAVKRPRSEADHSP